MSRDEAIQALIQRYAPTLSALAHGPTSTEWPCSHKVVERDARAGRWYCRVCFHWVATPAGAEETGIDWERRH